MAVDTELLEVILRYTVLPIVIGLFFAFIVFYYDYIHNDRKRTRENLDQQLEGARLTYNNIMQDAERLYALMRYHAWNVAWRKVRPEGIFSEDLIEEDEIKWRQFDDALSQWRRHKIQYKSAIECYFGKRTSADKLFHLMDASFDKLAFELWFIYHGNPSNPNVFMQYYVEAIDQEYDSVFNVIMTANGKTITSEQEDQVTQITSSAFDELQDKMKRMSNEMTESIRKENVGNLRRNRKGLVRRSSSRR
jgi:hypothetical protein